MQDDNNNNKKNNSVRITKLYVALIVLSIVIMIIAAVVTYGYNPKKIHVSFGEKTENQKKQENTTGNKIEIGGVDLSRIPSDEEIKDIFNDVMPNVCEDCNDEYPIECLEEYKINKILIQGASHRDHLFLELLTGKEYENTFKVAVDLNTNTALSFGGDIDNDMCIDIEIDLSDGHDLINSEYTDKINIEK